MFSGTLQQTLPLSAPYMNVRIPPCFCSVHDCVHSTGGPPPTHDVSYVAIIIANIYAPWNSTVRDVPLHHYIFQRPLIAH